MDALNTFLAEEDGSTKPYAIGGRLTSLDASVYGILGTMIGEDSFVCVICVVFFFYFLYVLFWLYDLYCMCLCVSTS